MHFLKEKKANGTLFGITPLREPINSQCSVNISIAIFSFDVRMPGDRVLADM